MMWKGNKNDPAIEDEYGNKLTYGQMINKWKQIVDVLEIRSVIYFSCKRDIESVSLLYCIMDRGMVPILMEPYRDASFVIKLVEKYKTRYVWIEKDLLDDNEVRQYIDTIIEEKKEYIFAKTVFDNGKISSELALLLSTSGSTGSAKLVRISKRNIISGVGNFSKAIGIRRSDKLMTVLPISYCFGGNILLCAWLVGASIFVTERSALDPSFIEILKNREITTFFAVPYTMQLLEANGFFENHYLSLSKIVIAGSKLELNKAEKIDLYSKDKLRIHYGYGQTEGTTCLTLVDVRDLAYRGDTIGKPIDGVKALVECSEKQDDGELIFEGDAVSLGYANAVDDLERNDENRGVLHSGDAAYIDDDGYIYLKGRMKRIIKVLGNRMSLDEIESMLSKRFERAYFACVGNDDSLQIYYEASGDIDALICEYINQELKIPLKMISVTHKEYLDRMKWGKIDYNTLRESDKIGVG